MSKITVANKWVDSLCILADKMELDYEIYEGSLNNNYIFYDTKDIKIKGIRRTKYIIIKEVYVNSWASELQLIVTDDIKKINQYQKTFEEVA